MSGALETGVISGTDGLLYGVTYNGGRDFGSVFTVSLSGNYNILYEFDLSDGAYPDNPLLQGRDAAFYGTTLTGEQPNIGEMFRITADGTLNILYGFPQGVEPSSALAEDEAGNFFGTTSVGGAFGDGSIFKLSPDGIFETVYSFNITNDQPAGDILLINGHIIGTTFQGGANGDGEIYDLAPDGTFVVLHTFSGSDGVMPTGLLHGSDGNYYGTTRHGGSTGSGSIFQMTPEGAFTTLYSLGVAGSGGFPSAGLVQASDGAFYGVTEGGGDNNTGTIYRISIGLPASPLGLKAKDGTGQVTLKWKKVAGADSYDVFEGKSSGGERSQPIKTGVTGDSFVVQGLKARKHYYFEVAAVNATGIGPKSNEVKARPR